MAPHMVLWQVLNRHAWRCGSVVVVHCWWHKVLLVLHYCRSGLRNRAEGIPWYHTCVCRQWRLCSAAAVANLVALGTELGICRFCSSNMAAPVLLFPQVWQDSWRSIVLMWSVGCLQHVHSTAHILAAWLPYGSSECLVCASHAYQSVCWVGLTHPTVFGMCSVFVGTHLPRVRQALSIRRHCAWLAIIILLSLLMYFSGCRTYAHIMSSYMLCLCSMWFTSVAGCCGCSSGQHSIVPGLLCSGLLFLAFSGYRSSHIVSVFAHAS